MCICQITAVINAHREGLLAVPTLRSAEKAVSSARHSGLTVEIVAVLDRSDNLTSEIFEEWASRTENIRVYYVDYGDAGLSRNYGASVATGDWVSFLDADDLWSENWLTAAFLASSTEHRLSVWHPKINLYFGVRPHIYLHTDMDDPGFDLAYLVETNLWTSLSFSKRELLSQVPFQATSRQQQIGYEDWGWNIEVIHHGAVHKTVADAVHAIRTKQVSTNSRNTAARCLPHPSVYFRSILKARRKVENERGVGHTAARRILP